MARQIALGLFKRRIGHEVLVRPRNGPGNKNHRDNNAEVLEVHGQLILSAVTGLPLLMVCSYRFFSVMLMPKLSIMINEVSKSGFLVTASM